MIHELTGKMRIVPAKLEDFRTQRDPLYLARSDETTGNIDLWQVVAVLTEADARTGERSTKIKVERHGQVETCLQNGLDDCVFHLFAVPMHQ